MSEANQNALEGSYASKCRITNTPFFGLVPYGTNFYAPFDKLFPIEKKNIFFTVSENCIVNWLSRLALTGFGISIFTKNFLSTCYEINLNKYLLKKFNIDC